LILTKKYLKADKAAFIQASILSYDYESQLLEFFEYFASGLDFNDFNYCIKSRTKIFSLAFFILKIKNKAVFPVSNTLKILKLLKLLTFFVSKYNLGRFS
jgi:hypothetical protein